MEHYIIGVDTGQRGGIAVIDLGSEKVIMCHLYDTHIYKSIFQTYKRRATLYIEQVHAMPKQGVSSTFTFGANYGLIQGMAIGNNVRVVEVSPQKWKKHFGLDNDKKKSIELVHKLYPDIDLNIGKRKVIESDGMAEAILIAKYGMEVENG